jgi:DNA-directed RNA polymerase specialized sigma24 family protein
MAMRIVKDDFWATIKTNEDLIRKCFFHIVKRYPDIYDGAESVYASMLIWLNEKNILNKFDNSRTREGKSEDVAWQHFVFCYIQKFLENNYYNNTRYKLRNSTDENIDSYHVKSYPSLRRPDISLFDDEADQAHRDKNGSTKKQPRTSRLIQGTRYPTIEDFGACNRSEVTDTIETLELSKAIQGQLKNDLERLVIKGCYDGLNHKEIANNIGYTPAAVSAMVQRIKKRCVAKKVFA